MAANDSDDPSFTDEMMRMGVVPMERTRSGKRAGSGSSRSAAGKGRDASRSERPRGPEKNVPAPAPAPAPERPARTDTALEQELSTLRGELARITAEHAALARERHAWLEERARLEAGWQEERARLEQAFAAERKARDARDRELRHKLQRAETTLARHVSLMDALAARGCQSESEATTVLRELLDVRPRDLLDAVDLLSADALAQLLDQRVAFVAEGVDMATGPDCVIVRVPPERCEVTGGSDIQAAFRKLVAACRRAGIAQLTIVGGSPAYRRQLSQLAERFGEGVLLNLVSGTIQRKRKRAEADMRSSDRVIIWGATELDHSVSAVYMGAPEKTLRVVHRGISRMLLQVAESLESSLRPE